MNYVTPEQLVAAQKSNVETFFSLSGKALEGVEKLVALNLEAARAALSDSAEATHAVLGAKNPQDLVALQQALMQPAGEKALAYFRKVYEIATSANAEAVRVAEEQFAGAQKATLAVVDSAVKNAPAGSENVVALVKSAVQAANNAVEGVQKAAKQAADVAQANITALSNAAVSAAPAKAARARRA